MKKGVKLLEDECADAAKPRTCLRLADLYKDSNNLPRDIGKAVEYAEKACGVELEQNARVYFVTKACEQAATTRRRSADEKLRDWSKIVALYDRACTLESSRGCEKLADLYQGGAGTEFDKDPEKAKAYRSKACLEGSRRSCTHEGH